jgi:hypothetical protein
LVNFLSSAAILSSVQNFYEIKPRTIGGSRFLPAPKDNEYHFPGNPEQLPIARAKDLGNMKLVYCPITFARWDRTTILLSASGIQDIKPVSLNEKIRNFKRLDGGRFPEREECCEPFNMVVEGASI